MKEFDDKIIFGDIEEDVSIEIDYDIDRREFTLTDLCNIAGLAPSTVENHLRQGHFGRKYTRLDPLPNGEKRFVLPKGAIAFFKEKRWRIQDTSAPKAVKVNVADRDTNNYFYVRQYNKSQCRRLAAVYTKTKLQDYLFAAQQFGYSTEKDALKRKYKEIYLPYYRALLPTVREVSKERKEEWEVISDIDIPFNLLGEVATHYSPEEREYFMIEYVSFVESYNTEDPIQRFTIISMIDEQLRQQRLRKRMLGLADYIDEDIERALTNSVNRWKILNEKLEKRVATERPKIDEEQEKKPEFKVGGAMS